jgi:hypothetical protein
VLTGMKWAIASVGTILVLGLVFGVLGFALGWYHTETDVVSPENVKAQYQDAYSNFEALKATAGDVCSALAAVGAETDPDAKSQRVSEELAYEQNYRRIAAAYDAAYDNAFAAKHVGPTDLPHTAPELDAELTTVGCHQQPPGG